MLTAIKAPPVATSKLNSFRTGQIQGPFVLASRYPPPHNPAMRILTYNILEGGVGRTDPLAEVIRLSEADIVLVQESTDALLFHKLADRLQMDRFLAENPRNAHGAVGLLTRGRIRQAVNHAPLDVRITRSVLTATVEVEGTPFHVLNAHLHAGQRVADEVIRLSELPALLEIARTLPAMHILAGDFNSIHPDQVVDPGALREKIRTQLASQHNQLPRELLAGLLSAGYVVFHDLGPSFPTSRPALRVDHMLFTKEFASQVRSCHPFMPEMARFASDHFPLLAECL